MQVFVRCQHRAFGQHFRAAIEVLSSVLSCPEPGVAICDIGRRDVPFDAGLPVALWTKRRGSFHGVAAGCGLSFD